jgi:hypothetical protein
MDYVYFALIILFFGFLLFLLTRYDRRAKNRYRKTAYSLLETDNPDLKEIKNTIKGLHLYGGRWRKNKEFQELIMRLHNKLDSLRER